MADFPMWFVRFWMAAVTLLQWVFFVATAFMADCRGAGLAESPSLLLYLASATALTAALTESQLFQSCCSFNRLKMLGFTALNFFDAFTDSLSAGSVVASHLCEESKMDEAWLRSGRQPEGSAYRRRSPWRHSGGWRCWQSGCEE
mmetsp:Transcript_6954/g.14881  ORF Transcript_6954/g.14881 Transcript_6954/m.14881 type:complete len:145 (-) Transcript_6954:87-521(-)